MVFANVKYFEDVLPSNLFHNSLERLAQINKTYTNKTNWYSYILRDANSETEGLINYLIDLIDPKKNLFEGVEWWLRIKPIDDKKPFHFDKDEYLYKEERRVSHPVFASVFYFNEYGGETVVVDQILDPISLKLSPEFPTHQIKIKPKGNSFFVFPGELYHGVLSSDIPQTERNKLRVTLLVNWWKNKPSRENFLEYS